MTILHGIALTALAGLAHVTVSAVRGDTELQDLSTRLACAGAFVAGSVTVIVTGTWIGSLTGAPVTGFYGGHAVATALWTAIAALLMTTVAQRVDDRGRWSGSGSSVAWRSASCSLRPVRAVRAVPGRRVRRHRGHRARPRCRWRTTGRGRPQPASGVTEGLLTAR